MTFLHNMFTYMFEMQMIQVFGRKFDKNLVWDVNISKEELKNEKKYKGMEPIGRNFVLNDFWNVLLRKDFSLTEFGTF